ncbi:MAG TPA: hypothetical protein VNN72_30400 [Polyangiaceae bacterium]|nr:hypothetical protein [Polyangiaceae bacterium]
MLTRASCLAIALAATACLQNHELFHDVAAVRHATGESCAKDDDCVTSNVCTDQVCAPCPAFMHCRDNFSALPRNGCTWCAPYNDCTSDEQCPSGTTCYAGAQCPPGCDGDPACCYGNRCSDPSCPPPNLDCSVAGCADGSNCIGSGQFDGCECDPSTHEWTCMMHEGPENQCDGFRGGGGPPGGPGGRM